MFILCCTDNVLKKIPDNLRTIWRTDKTIAITSPITSLLPPTECTCSPLVAKNFEITDYLGGSRPTGVSDIAKLPIVEDSKFETSESLRNFYVVSTTNLYQKNKQRLDFTEVSRTLDEKRTFKSKYTLCQPTINDHDEYN